MNSKKTGVWLIGAYGDISTTLMVGCHAIHKGLVSDTGLVTALSPINQLNLIDLNQLVFGGHDIIDKSVFQQAEQIGTHSRTFPYSLVQQLQNELEENNKNICTLPELSWEPTTENNNQPTLKDLSELLREQLRSFIKRNNLDRVVMVNLSSAEPYIELSEQHENLDTFEQLLNNNQKDQILPSMLCAYAAFKEHCSYINFSPNIACAIGALKELALNKNTSFYGNDGKTGETLLKTALAPMFAERNLRIMSWEGINLLGNGDGKTLNDTEKCKNKINNKEAVLNNILGYPVHAGVSINYVPSLGDWKTAWDLIHFQGFLDVPMTMQFTWQGCDSILAAPLVIDMIRLTDFADRNNESGPMHHFACFFKNPIEINEHSLFKQFEMLLKYTHQHLEKNS